MYFALKLGLAGLNLITKSIRQAKMVGAQAVYQNQNYIFRPQPTNLTSLRKVQYTSACSYVVYAT